MKLKAVLIDFSTGFGIVLVVSVMATSLWNLSVHGTSIVDWQTSFCFALIFGVLLTWLQKQKSKGVDHENQTRSPCRRRMNS